MQVNDNYLYQHIADARDVWLGTLPADSEIPKHQFSKKFERRMAKLLKEQRRSREMNRILRTLKRSVVVAVLALAVAFGGVMTVEAYREKVIEIVVKVFHDLTEYRYTFDLEEAYLPTVEFGYVPEGMRETECRTSGEKRRSIMYENEKGLFFELRQNVIKGKGNNVSILDTENAETEYFTLRGNDAVINTKDGYSSLYWIENNVRYAMYSFMEPSEMIKIAENLKIS